MGQTRRRVGEHPRQVGRQTERLKHICRAGHEGLSKLGEELRLDELAIGESAEYERGSTLWASHRKDSRLT